MADLAAMADFNTFEDFLDSQVAPIDLYYLEVSTGSCDVQALGWQVFGRVVFPLICSNDLHHPHTQPHLQ
jgi:hypothetical protein